MNKNAIVLGCGANALWVVRSLGRKNVSVFLYDKPTDDITYHSRYVNVLKHQQTDTDQDIVKLVIETAKGCVNKPVLFYCSDYWLKFVSANIEQLNEYVHLVISSKQSVDIVVDKNNFQKFSSEHSVPVPYTWAPGTKEQLLELIKEIDFPVIIKPEHSYQWQKADFTSKYGNKKMFLITTEEQLIATWQELQITKYPVIIQQYLKGGDSDHYSYISYRDRNHNELLGLCVKKERISPIHEGVACFVRVKPDPENTIAAISRETLDKLNYIGATSVCFKRDEESCESKIFEINGRLPLVHSVFQMCGLDLPWIMYQDAIGEELEALEVKQTYPGYWSIFWADFGAFKDYRTAGELTFIHWLKSYLKIKMIVEFAPDDIKPMLYTIKKKIKNVLNKMFS